MLVVIKATLYEGAVALRASVNFRKDLGWGMWDEGWGWRGMRLTKKNIGLTESMVGRVLWKGMEKDEVLPKHTFLLVTLYTVCTVTAHFRHDNHPLHSRNYSACNKVDLYNCNGVKKNMTYQSRESTLATTQHRHNLKKKLLLLLICWCCLPVALVAVQLTLSRNISHLNLNRKP